MSKVATVRNGKYHMLALNGISQVTRDVILTGEFLHINVFLMSMSFCARVTSVTNKKSSAMNRSKK